MKKFEIKHFGLTVFLVATISFIILGLIDTPNTNNGNIVSTAQKDTGKGYMLGISGFTPANFPDSSTDDLEKYWKEINNYTDIYGIHVGIDGLSLLDTAASSLSVPFEVVTGLKESENWLDNKDRVLNTLTTYLNKYPQIKYLALGNEINIHYDLDSEKFDNFFEAYKYLYTELKKKFPDLKISTTFQYEALIGSGFLMGKDNPDETDMVGEMLDYLDVVSLTVYPYFDFKNPDEIPLDYFAKLLTITSKPIVITETGWISRSKYIGSYAYLTDQGYSGSEDEQVKYLSKLVELIKEYGIEYANWIGLNDFYLWSESSNPFEGHELFDSIGLRHNDGREKLVWDKWVELIVR